MDDSFSIEVDRLWIGSRHTSLATGISIDFVWFHGYSPKPAIHSPAKFGSCQSSKGMMGLLAFFSTQVKVHNNATELIKSVIMKALFHP
jgi:hypothetical protein